MPSINFKKFFVLLIENGSKRQTIRKTRKRLFQVGDTLYLFTGMRTKLCKRAGQYTCVKVEHIIIDHQQILIDGASLNAMQTHSLAVADGFANTNDFMTFFKQEHTLPFEGQIIHW